jgi:hypothetical protein
MHANKVMQALAECIKAFQGMIGKARISQAAQDLQHIIDATQACIQTNPHQFEEMITPVHFCNTQQVPRVQAPASIPIPHTDDNRQTRAPWKCRHHLQGSPQIFLQSNQSMRPALQPSPNLAANPPH